MRTFVVEAPSVGALRALNYAPAVERIRRAGSSSARPLRELVKAFDLVRELDLSQIESVLQAKDPRAWRSVVGDHRPIEPPGEPFVLAPATVGRRSARLFVGCTRPKELLCLALHREGVTGLQAAALQDRGWSVADLSR